MERWGRGTLAFVAVVIGTMQERKVFLDADARVPDEGTGLGLRLRRERRRAMMRDRSDDRSEAVDEDFESEGRNRV